MKYRKKPVVIEAVKWNKDNLKEICDLNKVYTIGLNHEDMSLIIPTLEGNDKADVGDWIIKGVKGELYVCKPNIFEATYKPV